MGQAIEKRSRSDRRGGGDRRRFAILYAGRNLRSGAVRRSGPDRRNGSLSLVVADADIQRAARERVERYGDSAVTIAQERVDVLSASQDQSEVNVALRVLSAVEALLTGEPK